LEPTTPPATVSNVTFTDTGYYFWVVSVPPTRTTRSAGPEGCNSSTEQVLVSKLTPTGGTTILLDDSVTVTGDGTHIPDGSATFSLYKDDATCAVAASLVYGPVEIDLDSAGSASTTANVETVAGSTYRWKVTYSVTPSTTRVRRATAPKRQQSANEQEARAC
jgi:hypothetical protein